MTKQKTSARVAVCALAGTLMLGFAGAAIAGEVEKTLPRGNKDEPATKAAAVAPFARLAAYIRPGPVLARQKGVLSVTNPARGVYCIRPTAASGVDPADSVVIVSPEFRFSAINEVMVQWIVSHHGCGSDRIGVVTLADFNANGIYSLSDEVAFSVYVP